MNINELLDSEKGKKRFMLGNEAAVRGVLEAGVSLAATYPGTPSSEIGDILFHIAKDANIYFEFSANEKVAIEVAASAASSGLRTFSFMKHVGVNVAADSLMTSAYMGVEGSFLILVADDPSTFSSQNEQDTRHFARQANIPIFEPSNPQEIKDFIHYAYDISDKYNIPVIIRTTTRVSHMRGIVETDEYTKNTITSSTYENKGLHVPVPEIARVMHKNLVEKIHDLREISNKSPLNKVYDNGANIGVITSGGAYNYVADVINQHDLSVNILKLGFSHPFPEDLVKDFLENNDEVLVVEEVDPINEMETLAVAGLNNINTIIHGKKDGSLPEILEYTPDILYEALQNLLSFDAEEIEVNAPSEIQLPSRPANLCSGCPHRASFYAARQTINKMNLDVESIHPSDIGCYTLGIAPPYNMANYLMSMGASVGASCGFSKATDNQPIISFIGDSTFFHAGIPPLINAIHNKMKFTLVILDNRITAMTGGQTNPGIPIDGMGDEAPAIDIESLVKSIGVGFVESIDPMNVNEMIDLYQKALSYDGVSVIIAKHPCVLINKKEIRSRNYQIKVDSDKCIHCNKCTNQLACPSINEIDGEIRINQACTKCGVCINVCPTDAIHKEE
ncbi:indolepyruvate ferredoxin oxidoreductase subunit alpha [Methanosphaera sp. WGK6]|uniref:indolepyruvate ferredoxin oxidoreductase subunit alpha n=1 Tax=Methanosphaera sp. WGK6 TaxID=1561964 RepID=UPI00084C3411|nr:indolepyruvate ferredoxin oxidoreductase subunit alpha [Methanosphaera sp. WGK6]OED30544.1 indolepyruvate ferredoxin oxidoreductase [Methanosphaera sp. WGK6]